ncbi:MAG: hypothetical protein LQ350_007158 [Teloschistes chrysophthalmus]|nr:MAG: hypothetical protein LQ350_007158 [Niorma chrysophthalma]
MPAFASLSLFSLLISFFLCTVAANPIQRTSTPSRFTVTLKLPTNSTTAPTTNDDDNYHLSVTLAPWRPLDPVGATAAIRATLSQAGMAGYDQRLPPAGWYIIEQGTWLDVQPVLYLNWGLVVFALTQVKEELQERGWWKCDWRLTKKEGGLARTMGKGIISSGHAGRSGGVGGGEGGGETA